MRRLLVLGWMTLVLGVVLQLWLKDHSTAWALLFYGMPKPCLVALALILALISGRRGKSQIAAVAAVFILSLWWTLTSYSPAREIAKPTVLSPASDEVTLLYWNLCRPSGLDQEMVDLVKELRPHIATFVEPGSQAGALLETYQSLLPGYQGAWMPRGILWFSLVPSRYRERGKLDASGAYARFEVNGLGPTFPVVVADVHPHLFHSRRQQLQEVLAQSQSRQDAILLGDFNTPLESTLLSGFRANYVEAFEVAGNGFRETWPSGLPLLSLDHAWIGHDWQVIEARKIWRLTGSDHAALFIRLRRR